MANAFTFRGSIYSISDKNELNEYVVVKLNKHKEIQDARITVANSEKEIELKIRRYGLNNFKVLPGFKDKTIYNH